MKQNYKTKQHAQEETVKLFKDFYYENGYKVMTEEYHLKRGHCCQSGCKHCPYGFDKKTGTIRKDLGK